MKRLNISWLLVGCIVAAGTASARDNIDAPRSALATATDDKSTSDEQWAAMEAKRKQRFEEGFRKLDKNDDKKLSFDEFLKRYGSIKAIADKPDNERSSTEQKRLDQFQSTFKTKFDGNQDGTLDFEEYMTRYYRPTQKPEAVKAEKAQKAKLRDDAKAERERKVAQRDADKKKREKSSDQTAEERAKAERDKLLDRPKANRDRDE